MNINLYEPFLSKKELSSKNRKEINDLLQNETILTKDDVKLLIDEILIKLNPKIIYQYINSCFVKLGDNLDKEFINHLLDINPNKALHVYASIIALYNLNKNEDATQLFTRYMSINTFSKKKINKNLVNSFSKITSYFGWEQMIDNINNLTPTIKQKVQDMVKEAVSDCKDDVFNKKVTEVIGDIAYIEKKDENIVSPEEQSQVKLKSIEKKENYTIENCLSFVKDKFNDIVKENHSLNKEKEELNDKIGELKKKISELVMIGNSNEKTISKLNDDLININKENKKLCEEKEKLGQDVTILKNNLKKLNEVYDSAGSEKINELKHNLRDSLKPYYRQYEDIKDEEPDMGYYPGLMSMIDEIYSILKSNGIKL